MNTLFNQLMSKVDAIANRPGHLMTMADAILARVARKDSAAALPSNCWYEYKDVNNCIFRRACCRMGSLIICDSGWDKMMCY